VGTGVAVGRITWGVEFSIICVGSAIMEIVGKGVLYGGRTVGEGVITGSTSRLSVETGNSVGKEMVAASLPSPRVDSGESEVSISPES